MVVVKRVLWKSGLKLFARAYEVAFGRTEIPFLTSIIKPHGLHPPYAASGPRAVQSPRPARRPSTDTSSFSASGLRRPPRRTVPRTVLQARLTQCSPMRLSYATLPPAPKFCFRRNSANLRALTSSATGPTNAPSPTYRQSLINPSHHLRHANQ